MEVYYRKVSGMILYRSKEWAEVSQRVKNNQEKFRRKEIRDLLYQISGLLL